ncbi:DUF1028 domain-containing protein [Rhizobium multihospitium]|uniref:Uncharacterized conserved protein, Ntn-hydrolase superfamily n=1 Tax=Rhizobium multihospitium TaxID=410764 RepID=A0A1C3W1S5_9HYPH|nr:DUF1028 domain-containing protein [Rhizobium multihospitium]SCB33861.1 Uncharacterized conserved protein, Ntn-hydrolase superfamily [Rhizobium multihospitium]
MTFSIAARCADTGMFGIAISSSSPAVAARCSHTRAGAGVVASQNITDPSLGISGLEMLAAGATADVALAHLVAATPFAAYRQLAIVDTRGNVAGHSGERTLGVHAMAKGTGCIAAGNLLASTDVPQGMIAAFDAAKGDLPSRLIQALVAGLEAGGEAGPVRSAGLKVVRDVAWPVVDLRVDWHDQPIAALRDLWSVYEPQMEDYIRRALDPSAAPSFGVPGDE